MASASMYDTFGNAVSYKMKGDTLVAYIENSTIKFPLPDAGSEILATLKDPQFRITNSTQLDMVTARLEKAGYKKSSAKTFAPILLQVADAQGIDPLEFFNLSENTINFTSDAYNAMNKLRPAGSRVGIAVESKNSSTKARKLIKP